MTVPQCRANAKGRSLQKRPNTIILSHLSFDVNYLATKNGGFSLLYHFSGSYLCEIPS